MIALNTAANTECILTRYVSGFQVGTALPVTLPPGRYKVTRREVIDECQVVLLDNQYRVDAADVADRS
ncbi:hypothetical protein [Thalassoroseus pseudoceratinae]|uniref:hypothetical protein n=1 Tax=Thalassoroseus pseudoceratinae TaxID=2713176 RepID=UPI00142206E8|nr:hypothetical protein [Thalassoroseus pseudoceratinae]